MSYNLHYTTSILFQLRHFSGKGRKGTIAYVVSSGPIDVISRYALWKFLQELHKEIDIERAEDKVIYEEQFIRYHERKEKDVSKTIHKLYELYGYAQTRYDVKKNGNCVIDILRARLRIDDAEVHVKTYRPKKYNSPAQSLWDHPKIEATAYYTLSKDGQNRIEEIRELARDIIATIVDVSDLYEDLLPPGLQFDQSGTGRIREDILRSLRAGFVEDLIGVIEESPTLLIRNPTARSVLLFLAKSGPSTSVQISSFLEVPVRTIRYALKSLREKGLITSFRKGNRVFYQIGGRNDRGDKEKVGRV